MYKKIFSILLFINLVILGQSSWVIPPTSGSGSGTASQALDGTFRIYNTADTTKKLAFDASSITTATTRTISIPDQNGTVALTSDIPTASSGAVVFDAWEGDGTTDDFTMAQTIVNPEDIIVTLDGILQTPTTDYTVSGTTLHFITPPESLKVIESRLMSGSSNVYSTSETVIGTWLGSTLYRKIISIGSFPNNTSKSVAHGITGLNAVASLVLTCDDGTYKFITVGLGTPIDDTSEIIVYINGANVVVITGTDKTAMSGYAVIEYTKL